MAPEEIPSGGYDIPLEPSAPAREDPAEGHAPLRRGPPRFAIPAQTTVYEPGLPGAIIGSEHEAEASDDLPAPPIPDANTQALSSDQIKELLARTRRT